jgi:hypothetical protein
LAVICFTASLAEKKWNSMKNKAVIQQKTIGQIAGQDRKPVKE